MNGVSKPTDEFATPAAYMTAETQLIAQVHEAIKPRFLLDQHRGVLESRGLGARRRGRRRASRAHELSLHRSTAGPVDGDRQSARDERLHRVRRALGVHGLGEVEDLSVVSGPGCTRRHSSADRWCSWRATTWQCRPIRRDYSSTSRTCGTCGPIPSGCRRWRPTSGHPREARHVIASGVDAAAQKYRIYARDFDNAYMVIRPQIDWRKQTYADSTGSWFLFPRPCGRCTAMDARRRRSRSVTLRNVEAAILFK